MNKKLNYELAKQYYMLAPRVGASSYGLMAIILYFFWGHIPSSILIAWAVIVFLMATMTLITMRLFTRYANEDNGGFWLKVGGWTAIIHDVPLGLIGPMGFMVDNVLYQILTLFMLAGMTAGAILTRGVVFNIYVLVVLSLLSPTIVTMAFQPTVIAKGMLVLTIIYLFFMISVAKNYSSTIINNFLLWLDNEKLVSQLMQSHTEVEETNRVLTNEIEHRKMIEGQLVDAKERSEQANEAKNQFLANVSHELRTPLNGIMGFANLLQGEKLSEIAARYANQIGNSAKTLLRIVNDILDITAIEAGHITFYEDTFSLRAELSDVISVSRPMAESKNLSLVSSIDEDVEDCLHGDANRLRQIIANLLTNAVKYTKQGGIKIHVSRKGERDDRVVIRFDVEDTGIGIADEALNSIFNNFTRVEGFETRHNEGVGLGLAIVKSLLQKMDGEITVQSKLGEGSCFSIEIPFVRSVEKPQDKESVEQVGITPEQWKELRVLVVDDNDVNRMVLAAFLSKAGIPFAEAENGFQALEQVRNNHFDVVLLDIQMPDLSGTEVAIQIHKEYTEPPVLIAATAHAFPEQREAMLRAGFADFLIKPISDDALLKILAKAYMGGYDQTITEASTAE